MPDECRPPDGTPDGAVCVLREPRFRDNTGAVMWIPGLFVWHRNWFGARCWYGVYPQSDAHSISSMTRAGWRFHSIAEVPHD